jgi:YtxH-like protein
MKISDIRDLSKEDVLSALGLVNKPTGAQRVLGTLGILSIGLVVGAGAALLLAPQSGEDLRGDLGLRLRKLREENSDGHRASKKDGAHSSREEVRT